MLPPLLLACACACAITPGRVRAQEHEGTKDSIVTTTVLAPAETRVGARYRPDYSQAVGLIAKGDHAGGAAKLWPVLAFCDALPRPGLILAAVVDAREYEAYVGSLAGGGGPVEWVDMVCPWSYKAAAFSAVERGQLMAALTYLDKANGIAPFWADSRIERGYVLVRLGRVAEGLASYEEAVALASRLESNRDSAAMAHRGMGHALVELGALDRAEQAYRTSLDIEPGNRTALNELEYIRRKRGD